MTENKPLSPSSIPRTSPGTVPDSPRIGTRLREWKRHKIICDTCNSRENLIRHHILPAGIGGNDDKDNCAVLCYSCHKIIHQILDGIPLEVEHIKWTLSLTKLEHERRKVIAIKAGIPLHMIWQFPVNKDILIRMVKNLKEFKESKENE